MIKRELEGSDLYALLGQFIYFGRSAVGDVNNNPVIQRQQHNTAVLTLMLQQRQQVQPYIYTGEVADKTSRTSYTLTTSALIHQSCLPAEMRISSLSNPVEKKHLRRA